MKLLSSSLFAVCGVSLFAFNIQAQDVEHIEVSSSRYQNKLLTSQNVLVNASDLVEKPSSLANWLETTPGVSLNGQGGQFQSYSIRGFSKARIKTEVNGVPILTDRRAGNSAAFIPSSFIEGVDIRKGPSSAYYGSDAMGGVVSTQLKHPDGLAVLMGYQTGNNTQEVGFLYGNDMLGGAFSYQEAGNSTAPNGELLNTAFQNMSGLLTSKFIQGNYTLSSTVLLSQGLNIAKSSAQFPEERITIYPFDDHFIGSLSIDHDQWGQFNLGFHDQHWQSDITRIEKRKNVTEYQSQTINVLWQKGFQGFFALTEHNSTSGKWGLEFIKRNNVEIYEQEFDAQETPVYQHGVVDAMQRNGAVFVHQYGQWQDWQWSLGARVDWVEQAQWLTNPLSISDNFNSLTSSITKSVTSKLRLEAEMGNSFRFATLSERFFDGETPRGETKGNPSLLPEESLGGQLRVNYALSKHVLVDASVYRYGVDNYIERYQQSEQVLSYRNTQSATIYGAEIMAKFQQNADINHDVSYQYNRGENDTSGNIDDINPDSLNWRAQINWRNWNINNQFTYRFEKGDVGNNEQLLPSAFIWHINAHWQVNQQWLFGINVNNITNELYRSTADEDAPWQSERSVSLTVKYQR